MLLEDVKQALQEGTVTATITQDPLNQGYIGVQIMEKYLAYGQISDKEFNFTELSIITKYCLDK